jgi:GT2 family glycosyltransferase
LVTVGWGRVFTTRGARRRLRRWLPGIDPLKSTTIRKLYGGFVLARREALDRAGWFDDRYFMYAEDVDLSRTLTDLGWKLYYCADAEIIHVSGGTSSQAPSGFSVLMKNQSINLLLEKYQGRTGALLHRAAVALGAAARLLVLLLLWPVHRVRGGKTGASAAGHGGSTFKHRMNLLWALGLRKPVVATKRPATAPEVSLPVRS